MNHNYILFARGNYFKFIITSVEESTGIETTSGMYDLPIKQCYTRGIYVNKEGDIIQKGLVFLCAFPYKQFNIYENQTSITETGQLIEIPNRFFVESEPVSMYDFFENLLRKTAL